MPAFDDFRSGIVACRTVSVPLPARLLFIFTLRSLIAPCLGFRRTGLFLIRCPVSRIVLNDGKTGSNPNPIPFIGAGADATVRRGDTIANLSGILSFGFGGYRIEPTTLPLSFTASNPRPMAPSPVGGSLRVASFNVENFFVTTNPDPNYRGPNNATEFTRKRDKVVEALTRLNADVIGLIELEKATTNGGAASVLAAALTTAMGGGSNTYAAIADP